MNAAAGTADRRIDGGRVRLHRLREADLAIIDAWYEEAARAAFEDRTLEQLRRLADAGTAGLLAIQTANDNEPIGLLKYVVSDGWLAVPFIALAKAYRGWGYGSEVIGLLEQWAVDKGLARRFQAEIPVRNGLALYFWLRSGYRPARRDEFGWQEEGEADRMAMVRVVETAGAANAS